MKMAKSYGVLGLAFGHVFASITSSSKKRGYEEMMEIAQMYMIPEFDIVVYKKSKKREMVDIYYKGTAGTISLTRTKSDTLVQTISELADKNGESNIVAMNC